MSLTIALPENPSTAVAAAGKDTLLSINNGTVEIPTWVLVGGQRNAPIARKADTLDASHKTSGNYKGYVAGLISWSIDYSGLYIIGDDGVKLLEYAFANRKQIQVKITYSDGSFRTGWAFVTAFSDDNAHDAISTLKVTLEGNGELSDIQPKATT